MSTQDPFGLSGRRIPDGFDTGATVNGVRLVSGAGVTEVVVLDRVADVARDDTDYCIHGQATCSRCAQWCWLGSETHRLVSLGQCAPLCRVCAELAAPAGDQARRLVGNADDHRRADGPHG